VLFPTEWTHYLDSVFAAGLVRIPLLLPLLEICGRVGDASRGHVNAADHLFSGTFSTRTLDIRLMLCIKRSPFARAEVGAPNWAFWSSASGRCWPTQPLVSCRPWSSLRSGRLAARFRSSVALVGRTRLVGAPQDLWVLPRPDRHGRVRGTLACARGFRRGRGSPVGGVEAGNSRRDSGSAQIRSASLHVGWW
jgi:hypothetical protein